MEKFLPRNHCLLHIQAEQHWESGLIRNAKLVDILPYKPNVSPEAMAAFIAEGTKVWADVTDADAWLAELRGDSA